MSGSGPWTETQTSALALIGCLDPPSPSDHHGWCQERSWQTGSSAESRYRCWNKAANREANLKGQRWRMPGIPDVSRTHRNISQGETQMELQLTGVYLKHQSAIYI